MIDVGGAKVRLSEMSGPQLTTMARRYIERTALERRRAEALDAMSAFCERVGDLGELADVKAAFLRYGTWLTTQGTAWRRECEAVVRYMDSLKVPTSN